jgi:16S rRNA (uracil1498-N3)-methyltransferase
MNLFYAPELTMNDVILTLDRDESNHCLRSLRRSAGQGIMLTNGSGLLAEGRILGTDEGRCRVQITNPRVEEKRPWGLHMAVAPPKNHDRFEWFAEKATEIGVESIIPLICHHSERKKIHQERVNRLLISAMKQSLKAYMPRLYPETEFSQLVAKDFAGLKLMASASDISAVPLIKALHKATDVLMLIGPEGDFSQEELALAKEHGFIAVSLGQNRLRTETAALAACAVVNIFTER